MALSPWKVLTRLSCDEIASMLAGFDISVASNSSFVNAFADEPAVRNYHQWRLAIVKAVDRNELTPCSDWEVGSGLNIKPSSYVEASPDQIIIALNMEANFEQKEVYRWLKSRDVSDDEIPEPLRFIPSIGEEKETQPNSDEPPSALAAIGALLNLLKDCEKPTYNQAKIEECITERFPKVHGLSESQLQKLFAKANKELDSRKSG